MAPSRRPRNPIAHASNNGDCESSVHVRVKCGRAHLSAFFGVVLAFSVAMTTVLHAKHQTTVDGYSSRKLIHSSTSNLPSDTVRRRSLQNIPSARASTGINQTPKIGKKKIIHNKITGRRRGEEIQYGLKGAKNTTQTKNTGVDKHKKGSLVQEKEVTKPLDSSLAPNATFAACLLIKDDNDILPEWLAYHYHVIGLRRLIVAVDPLSSQYPTKILEKWKSLIDMKIEEWTDDDYMPSDFLVYQKPPDQYMENTTEFLSKGFSAEDVLEISTHRFRQRVFLAKCMRDLRDKGNSWVMHIDTDEYITPSKLLRQMKPDYLTIPPMDQPGAVLNLLKQAVKKTPQQIHYPCLSLLRVLFGSVESTKKETWKNVPPGFNAEHFESLRWRYHAPPHNMTFHGNPKVIVDVSAIPEDDFPDDIVFSIHRPVQAYCPKNKEVAFTHFREQPIAVNHYLGSWERYAGRNDKRRSRAVYDRKANVRRGHDDGNRLWLKGYGPVHYHTIPGPGMLWYNSGTGDRPCAPRLDDGWRTNRTPATKNAPFSYYSNLSQKARKRPAQRLSILFSSIHHSFHNHHHYKRNCT
eukprot:scaffold2003_cov157-Amphora_coffeaeformis.AAC.4